MELVEQKISCPKTLALIEKIVTMHKMKQGRGEHMAADEIVKVADRKGLPIGNLTSQLLANLCLNPLDHYIKEDLKHRWYGRYMDDFVIIHPDLEWLKKSKEKISEFLQERLQLQLHPGKSLVKNCCNGIPFVGYRIFNDHTLIRGNTLRRFQKRYANCRRKVRKGKEDLSKLDDLRQSFEGHLRYANSWNLKRVMYGDDAI